MLMKSTLGVIPILFPGYLHDLPISMQKKSNKLLELLLHTQRTDERTTLTEIRQRSVLSCHQNRTSDDP